MKAKLSLYRPAAAAFLNMMAMAVTTSTLSFFLEPVCGQLGVGRGSFSLIFSLMTISCALSNPLLGQFAGRRGVRWILIAGGIWGCGSLLLFSLADTLWMVYLAAFLLGFFGTNCIGLCSNVIVQSTYNPRQASSVLGVVMAGSGAGGMIFNLIIPAVLAASTWQRAMQVLALCWLGVLLLSALLLGKETPLERRSHAPGLGLGMTRGQALRSSNFYLLALVSIIINAACGVQQQQPSLLGAYGYGGSAVSLMLSVQTGVLALGKIGQGFLYGHLGIRRGGCIMLIVFAVAFLVLLIPAMAWPGLLLMALGLGVNTTLMPLVARQIFGTREYASIWGLLVTVGSLGTIVANPLWGGTFDLTGSYTPALMAVPVLLLCAAGLLYRLLWKKS